MKKTILFVVFLSFSLLFFAKPADAIYVKVIFNINSVTSPVRAAAAGVSTATEFYIRGSSVTMEVVAGETPIAQKGAPTTRLGKNTPGSWFIVYNDQGGAQYRIKLFAAGISINIPLVDCSGFAGDPPGSATPYVVMYTVPSGTTCGAVCPNPPITTNPCMMMLPSNYIYFYF